MNLSRVQSYLNYFLVVLILLVLSFSAYKWVVKKERTISVGDSFVFTGQQMQNGIVSPEDIIQSQKLVLLFFSTKCPACTENQSFWNSINELSSGETRFHSICISDVQMLKKYIKLFDIKFSISMDKDNTCSVFSKNNINFLPTVLLLNRDKKIEKIWKGVLSNENKIEIIKVFKASSDH